MTSKQTQCLRLLTLLYGALMLYLLFFQRQPRFWEMPYGQCLRTGLELELFRATKRYLYIAQSDLRTAVIYLGGNILCFVPLGALLPLWRPRCRRLGRTLLLSFFIILAVELTQYLSTLGYFDIDDFLSNLLGAALGWLLWRLLHKE